MEGRFSEMEIYYGEDRAILESVCFFRKGCRMVPCHAYIAKGEDLADEPIPDIPCALILTGGFSKGLGQWKKSYYLSSERNGSYGSYEFMPGHFPIPYFLGGQAEKYYDPRRRCGGIMPCRL